MPAGLLPCSTSSEGHECLEGIIPKIKYFYEQYYAFVIVSHRELFLGSLSNTYKEKG